MRIVAAKARNAASIHQAVDEVVALHAVLVRGPVREVREGGLAELVLFELPVVLKIFADIVADRPIVIFALDRVGERLALRMALDTGVAGMDIIEPGGIANIIARWLGDMRLARTVASFAADVPFRLVVGGDIEVHGMAAVAER